MKSLAQYKREAAAYRAVVYFAVILFCVIFLVPIYGALTTAFRLNREIIRDGFWKPPLPPVLDNFATAFMQGNIHVFLTNTVIVTVAATAISIGLGCLTGYAFGKLRFGFSRSLFILIVAGMFFPPQTVLIPLFRVFNSLNLLDTLGALVIVHVGFGLPICTLILASFFRDIPDELRSSAKMDGCNERTILLRIMLPLARPAITALMILQFTWIWNDFLWPLVLIKTSTKMTIQMGVMQLRGQYGLAWGSQAAAFMIATIPTLLLFIFMQRHFIRGLSMGAVKE
ncbi:MAG: carbohydrate ABC transporter permease [Spirochaetaceae bacterium]|nr:MAG: carbohydrate ABC transporter permease [Spirochaetaceae bacterium]